jgi:hypothetical protein
MVGLLSLIASVGMMISVKLQYVNASSEGGFDCGSIVNCYGNGYDRGKENGANDWNDSTLTMSTNNWPSLVIETT